ncbi:MAG TPA: 16S rRNA (adenine(1518)-N(6)/adenine(1519)-N(6))-dimethyltransferase RsmA [Candidatus Syntrophosphaera sp.]|nr:16S rRNA (adenine(1518)-N(6)/adenine(1519)-N(6))-dimethyltransferase RsmA [Candidatus Syntrophosphaera sp.]
MRAIKALGQNFLNQPEIARKIVELAGIQPGETVWEIGPGHGILTRALLAAGARLRAFELDRRLEAPLRDEFGDSLELVMGDVLKQDWDKALAECCQPLKLVANIPYNISSPLLARLETHHQAFTSATLMVQKEVAERVCASPGCKAYGVMTLRLRRIFDAEILLDVPREYFSPAPKVDSAVLSLKPRAVPAVIPDLAKYLKLIELAFAHRRKTLRNNLASLLDRDGLNRLQQQSGIDLTRRGETLSEAEFIALSSLL